MRTTTVAWDAAYGVVNHTGMYAGYRRLSSKQKVAPPFIWEGRVRLNEVMNPPVFGFGWREGQTATYQPKLNFHPLYPSNNRNIVCGPGNVQGDPKVVGISAEMRDVRPERPYGVRTGYEQRYRIPLPSTPVDGQWHRFRWHVASQGEYLLYWDDLLVCHVIEKAPYTIDPGPVSVGLRLDFLDIDLGSMTLTTKGNEVTVFDHSRYDWYPTVTHDGVLFTPDFVVSSSGAPRPRLATPLDTFTVHYGGAGADWLDPGDTATELAKVETYWSIPQKKPNEYNSASDSEAKTWEWAGPYRAAHSAGNNDSSWGHLCVLGLEVPTSAQADRLIEGIRRARRQAVTAGYLTPNHRVVPHRNMMGAQTSCPGPLYTVSSWWDRIAAPLEPVTPPPPPTGGNSVFQKMIKQTGDPAVWALYSGGYKTWVPSEGARDFLIFAGGKPVEEIPVNRSVMQATGPVFGPIPAGYDEWGSRK